MSDTEIKNLLEKIDVINEALIASNYWISGSVIETTRKRGKTEKPFFYLSQSINGKNKITYIPMAKLKAFKDAVQVGKKVKKMLSEIDQLNIQLLKAGGNNA
jgi:hypothetical protein